MGHEQTNNSIRHETHAHFRCHSKKKNPEITRPYSKTKVKFWVDYHEVHTMSTCTVFGVGCSQPLCVWLEVAVGLGACTRSVFVFV